MIGLGIETTIELAGQSNEELVGKLEATYTLSKSAMWELGHPIDIGLVFEGRELVGVLKSHVETFTAIPAQILQVGIERSLSAVTRSTLFSIAHNALTNTFRHAQASKVVVGVKFQERGLRLSVSDDGIDLPDDYDGRGNGFRNMRSDAERMGGRLDVESDRSGRGTTLTCVIAHDAT